MSNIVKFPIERTNQRDERLRAGRADIVIFPGVRIERREFSLIDRHAKITRARADKVLAQKPIINTP